MSSFSSKLFPLALVLALVSLPALAGAEPQSGTGVTLATPAEKAACAVPAAIPGDGRDDRAAIQSALTTKKCAYLPAGVYDIVSIPFTPPARRPYMMLDLQGARLFGDGTASVLAFRGNNGGQDWEGIRMGGVGATLRDLSLDTSAISNTDEQTHAVKLLGPATDAEISHLSINHPIRAGKSGDCLQLVGYNDGREISRVKIHDNDFLHCDRSGIAVHSGTTQLEIVNNRFGDVGNTDLDFEGTGDTSDILIAHNTITMSPGPHGVGAIQLQRIDHARVTENTIDGRGIGLYQSDDVEIDDNTITLRQTTGESVLAVDKDSSRARILDNSITREASAGVGAVISAGPHGTGTPDHLEIDGNALVQRTGFHIVNTSGLVGLYVRHNTFTYTGAATNMWGLLALGSAGTSGIRTTDIRVEGNSFNGPLRGAFATSGSYFGVGTVDTAANVSVGPKFGFYCDNFASQGGVTGPITSTGDSWPAPACGPKAFVNVRAAPGSPLPPVPVGGSGAGAGGGGPAVSDRTAPVLSGLLLSRTRSGAMLRFTSSEAGTLSIRIDRLRPGRKAARAATLTRPIKAGFGNVAFRGSLAAKLAKPGRYRFTLTASDAAGNRGKPALRTLAAPTS